MELTQIRYFLEVAESEHITMSAEKLHIAQPALSQAIKRLEDEMGVPLFEKQGRNIVLTQYGKFMRDKLTPIMKEMDSLKEELSFLAHTEQKTIYINVLAATSMLTSAIIEYQNTHSDVNFKIMQSNTVDTYDIQITTKMFYQQSKIPRTNEFIFHENIYIAVPNNDKYKNVNSISLKNLGNEHFISLIGSRQFRYICDKFCHFAGIVPNIVFESDNPLSVQNMIAANMGIGFWPEHSWGIVPDEKIKLLPIYDPECSRDIIITYNKNNNNVVAEDFYSFLLEKANQLAK